MKKWRAILLFGGLLLMLVGYVAYSTRALYLSPRIDWHEDVGKQDRRSVKRWIKRNKVDYRLTTEWDMHDAWYCLRHPYRSKPTRVEVRKEGELIYIRSDWTGYVEYVELQPDSEGWTPRELTWEQSEYRELTW